MRSHIGSHPYGNPACAVDQQVREPRRQYGWLHTRIVEVALEVNRFFVDIPKQFAGDLSHSSFRITHCCGRIPVN